MKLSRQAIYYGTAGLTALLFAVWFILFPYASDDYIYMLYLDITKDGVPWPIDWKNMYDHWSWHYMNDNARIANLTAAFAYVLPKWLINSMSAVLWGFSLLMMGRIAGWNNRNWEWMAVLCLLTTIVPVWFDGMPITDFQFNYVWSIAIMLLCIYLFLRDTRTHWFIAMGFGGLMGVWSEAFSAPLFCAFFLLMILHKRFRTFDRFAFMAMLSFGLFMLLRAKGNYARLENVVEAGIFGDELSLLMVNIPSILFIGFAIWTLLRCDRELWREPLLQVIVVICASTAVVSVISFNLRAAWVGQIMGCWGLLILAKRFCRFDGIRWFTIAGLLSIVFISVHMIVTNVWTYKFRQLSEIYIEEYQREPHQTLFADVMDLHEPPFITLQKPVVSMQLLKTFARGYYVEDDEFDGHMMKIVPPELKKFTPVQAEQLPSGVWLYEGHYVTEMESCSPEYECFVVVGTFCSPMSDYRTEFYCTPFRADSGRTYVYVQGSWYEPHVFPINDIKLEL